MEYGINFPFSLDENKHDIALSSEEDNIKQSVYIILMTRKGERIMHPDFGCDLNRYVFELMDSSVLGMIRQEVVSALNKWEDRIDSIQVESGNSGRDGELILEVSYRIIENGVRDLVEIKV